MAEEPISNSDAMSLSSLDVISCGLGAAVLLFLVLSVVRSAPPAAGSSEFIKIDYVLRELRLREPGKPPSPATTPSAAYSLAIRPPKAMETIELSVALWDPTTGAIRSGVMLSGEERGRRDLLIASAPSGFFVLGPTAPDGGEQTLTVYVAGAAPGDWQIGLVCTDVQGVSVAGEAVVDVSATYFTRQGRSGASEVFRLEPSDVGGFARVISVK